MIIEEAIAIKQTWEELLCGNTLTIMLKHRKTLIKFSAEVTPSFYFQPAFAARTIIGV